VKVGLRTIVHSGAVIGSDGFGNAQHDGNWVKIAQLGGVTIGDDVEIGSNTSIDCGALEDTVIGNGVKIDNLVQIAHNVHIGDHTAVAGCVGIAGSTVVGKHCIIGGGTGVAGHIEIADKVAMTGMTMVTKSITQPGLYSSGTGVEPNAKWRKTAVRLRNLDDLFKRLKNIEKKLGL
jgi:UDP-3-O-[3-hydroxymyristoyl] glucosamine N-acyltransferase